MKKKLGRVIYRQFTRPILRSDSLGSNPISAFSAGQFAEATQCLRALLSSIAKANGELLARSCCHPF